MHANQNSNDIAVNQAELEGAIAELKDKDPNASALLVEHLKSAKMYLLGGMPEEYAAELQMAHEITGKISDRNLRKSASETIDHLRKAVTNSDATRPKDSTTLRHRPPQEHSPHNSAASRGRLWEFFGAPPIRMGTFYPTSFVAAVLPSYAAAERALDELHAVGFEGRDAIAVRSEEMSVFLKDLRDHAGAWGQLMASVSRMMGTEQIFTDLNTGLARTDSGFLLIYSPNEEMGNLIGKTVEPFGPTFMQRYMAAAVQGMVRPAGVSGPER